MGRNGEAAGLGLAGVLALPVTMFGLGAGGCSSPAHRPSETTRIRIAGFSTVYPLSVLVAEGFDALHPESEVEVSSMGSVAGFRDFCAGRTDLSDASRPINQAEIEGWARAGMKFIEPAIVFDAICVVVHPDNTWAQAMTLTTATGGDRYPCEAERGRSTLPALVSTTAALRVRHSRAARGGHSRRSLRNVD